MSMVLIIATLIQNFVMENGVAVVPFFYFLKSISAYGGHCKKANMYVYRQGLWAA
jgi:hypothetical protein